MEHLTFEDIQSIVAREETRILEFKKTTGELNDGMKSACAFLNTDGGWLLFGITPDLKIVGQNVADATRQEIARYLRKLEPAVDIPVQYIDVPKRKGFCVIAMRFPPASFTSAPYTYDGKPYYKVENTTVQMPRQMFEDRIRMSDPLRFSWERRKDTQMKIDDVDSDKVFIAIRMGVERGRIPGSALAIQKVDEALNHFELIDSQGDLINAANVVFGKHPEKEFIQCRLRLARFEGTDMSEFRDQTLISGNILVQLDTAMEFCRKHLFLAGKMDKGIERDDRLTVPIKVLRECILNMLVHRAWEAYNLTPSLAIFDDRIEFQNPGRFPANLGAKYFLKRPHSAPRNPVIAQTLYKSGITEGWGRGIFDIFANCKSYGLPEPEYYMGSDITVLTLKFDKPLSPTRENDKIKSENDKIKSENDKIKSENDKIKSENDKIKLLNKKEELFYNIIKETAGLTVAEIAYKAQRSYPTTYRYIKTLSDVGLIERRGSKKTGGYYIKPKLGRD